MTPVESARWRERIAEHWRITQDLDRALLRVHGISLSEFLTLSALDRGEGRLCAKDLVDVVGLSPSTLSRLLDRLERGGLLVRRAGTRDRRTVRLWITESGSRTARAATSTFDARLPRSPLPAPSRSPEGALP
ncbi:MarR family transcriptional regulator [Streptomyces hyaluromycini]|uniref:MarR family transcriptional regulator n=1 Tax=Streptomyces hyaluromycini TaxID=1377993 RepID=A0ABV1XF96_9ACTN